VAVKAARMFLNLPHYPAGTAIERVRDGVRYESARRTRDRAIFQATYEPVGAPFAAPPVRMDALRRGRPELCAQSSRY
jgi:uncharacterized protein YqjF (DUF2071 family)